VHASRLPAPSRRVTPTRIRSCPCPTARTP
jgi:hypothetical protein